MWHPIHAVLVHTLAKEMLSHLNTTAEWTRISFYTSYKYLYCDTCSCCSKCNSMYSRHAGDKSSCYGSGLEQ